MSIIKPRTARVVIYQGDDLARLAEADAKVTQAEVTLRQAERAAKNAEKQPRSMDEGDDPGLAVIAASEAWEAEKVARDDLAAEADERGVVVALRSLPRKDWRRLRNAHPPRDGNTEDEVFDCNVDSLPDEALPPSIDRDESTIEGDLVEFLDSLSAHDYYQRLFMSVLALNVGGASADPKLRVGSASSPTSSATSN
jgi:hypothetical protein